MSSRQSRLQEDTYYRGLRLLQNNPDVTQRKLATQLGINVGGLNYCLKALMKKGLVKMQDFARAKNKFGYVYALTPSGLTEKTALTKAFLQRKLEEFAALSNEIEAQREAVKIMAKNNGIHGSIPQDKTPAKQCTS